MQAAPITEPTEPTAPAVKPTRNPATLIVRWIAGFFGERAIEAERFLKFAIVGAAGAVVDFAILIILQHTLLTPEGTAADIQGRVALATGIAFTTAVISNFIWNRYWTFPDSRSRSLGRQLFQFFVVSIIGLAFRLVFVPGTFQFFGDVGASVLASLSIVEALDETAIIQLGTPIAQAIAIIIVLFWNFFANRYWTYNDV